MQRKDRQHSCVRPPAYFLQPPYLPEDSGGAALKRRHYRPLNYHSGTRTKQRYFQTENLPPTDVVTRKGNSPRREMGLEGRRGTQQTALSSDTDETLGDLLTLGRLCD